MDVTYQDNKRTMWINVLYCALIFSGYLVDFSAGENGDGSTGGSKKSDTKHPNIVFILTDDQDLTMNSLEPMTKLKELVGDKGAVFSNMFVTSPLCCPSRSSILTGRYVHNHGAVNNSLSGNCASKQWQRDSERKAFPAYLKIQGYNTFFAGKYLNQYGNHHKNGGVKHVPPGWDEWNGLVGNSRYYNYTLSVNGKKEVHGFNYEEDYLTDLIGRRGKAFLSAQIAGNVSSPFFMMLSTPACHAPFTPAPKYNHTFSQHEAPRGPSFDTSPQDKHWLIRNAKHPMSNSTITYIDEVYRNRWRTLLSVDVIVGDIVTMLENSGLLDSTYVIFTSDNGYHLGQFSLPEDKRQMYDFDLRVPFMIRGPGIQPGTTHKEPILNIDLAPTFLDIAGMSRPSIMDGRSILPLLPPHHSAQTSTWSREFYIEHQGEWKQHNKGCPQYDGMRLANCFPDCVCEDAANNTYQCLRAMTTKTDMIYCHFNDTEDFVEVYDLVRDPHQMTNIAGALKPKLLAKLRSKTNQYLGEKSHTSRTLKHLNKHLKQAYRTTILQHQKTINRT